MAGTWTLCGFKIEHGRKKEVKDSSPDREKSRIDFNDPLRLVPRVLTKLYSLWVTATYPFISRGRGISIHYTCELQNTGLMKLGNFLTIHKDVWLHTNPSSENEGEPVLTIGDYCFIARRCHIDAQNFIQIENGVLLAASVLIMDHGHDFSDITTPIRYQGSTPGGRIRIGEGSWIGQGAAIICDNGELTLGRNCVVAANAVVTRSAPPYSILAGNPARIVKQFDVGKGNWELGVSRTEVARPQPPSLATSRQTLDIAAFPLGEKA
jgi:acetyltransferase-like isoleucine patch superfamily enzyme